MGRIKTKAIKRITNKLVERYNDELTKDYTHNKTIVEKYTDCSSKKLKNIIAGYATRLIKSKKD